MTNLEHLGKRIKDKRIELNMTQEELAKKVGYTSRSSINKIELGLVDLPQSKITMIAQVLDVSAAYLMGLSIKEGEKMTEPMNDQMVEAEIARLLESPYVKLAKKEERIRNRRRQYMYSLRTMERRGMALAEAGITLEMLERIDRACEVDK